MKTAAEWDAFFDGRSPGCYNDADFRRIEATAPVEALEAYARFVTMRSMSDEYANHVRQVVPYVLGRLTASAKVGEINRNCFAVSMALLETLEKAGVWVFGLTGSARFRFPQGSGLEDQFFYATDSAASGHRAGHAWLVAPPFNVIDATAHFQGWRGAEATFLPQWIAVERAVRVPFDPSLHWPGMRPGSSRPVDLRGFSTTFPTVEIAIDRATILYQPHGVTVPAEPLVESGLVLGERSAQQFVDEEILPGLPREGTHR
ncbi:MAG: hypothetical protein K8W52_42655 [Deltaproteobacteria bacterium]|nr:hypothetical protein [Deltaproteobacteria bacterium]